MESRPSSKRMSKGRKEAPIAFDGIVLGGGKSKRMGTNKVVLSIDGKAMLHMAVRALKGANQVAVVAPAKVVAEVYSRKRPPGLIQTLEDPPFGGPVAGILAGLEALGPDGAEIVGIVAGDHPRAPQTLKALKHAGALKLLSEGSCDGVCAGTKGSGPQLLLGFYSRKYLESQDSEGAVGDGRDVSVKRLLGAAKLEVVTVPEADILDLDSPADLDRYGRSAK